MPTIAQRKAAIKAKKKARIDARIERLEDKKIEIDDKIAELEDKRDNL
jgi:hypothetical protein